MKNLKKIKFPVITLDTALVILRLFLGFVFLTHGVARLYYWSIPDFGTFLDSQGLPRGLVFAWTITISEIIGGILLALGILARYVLLFHSFVIICGVILVHLNNGWFVVGHGQGGVEYSLLISICLIILYSRTKKETGEN